MHKKTQFFLMLPLYFVEIANMQQKSLVFSLGYFLPREFCWVSVACTFLQGPEMQKKWLSEQSLRRTLHTPKMHLHRLKFFFTSYAVFYTGIFLTSPSKLTCEIILQHFSTPKEKKETKHTNSFGQATFAFPHFPAYFFPNKINIV